MAANKLEGKTIGQPSIPCQNCDEGSASKYCGECRLDLCPTCDRFHSRSGITKDHKVISVTDKISSTSKTQKRSSTCTKHNNAPLGFVCETCLSALCEHCKDDHEGHKVAASDLDVGILQKVCIQNIPGLLDLMQQLNKCNDVPDKIKLFTEARSLVEQWRMKIVTLTNTEADRLLKEIDAEIKKYTNLLEDHEHELKAHNQNLDKLMTNLNAMRRVSDVHSLVIAIQECNDKANDTKVFIQSSLNKKDASSVDKLLPCADKIANIEEMLRTTFTMTLPELELAVDFNDLIEDRTTALSSLDGSPYIISENRLHDFDNIVLFNWRELDICMIDINNMKKFAAVRNKKRISTMITMTHNQHVMIEYDGDKRHLHVLDKNFDVVATLAQTVHGRYTPRAICVESYNTFIMLESSNFKPSRSRFQRVAINNNSMSCSLIGCLDIELTNRLMSFHEGRLVVLETDTVLCNIDCITMKYTRTDLAAAIASIFIDDNGRTLAGDHTGNIHVLSSNGNLETVFESGKGEIGGAIIMGNKLLVSVDGYVRIFQT